MTLKQLEREVGGALFETDRNNRLTALGAFMLDTARLQIRSCDRTVEGIRAYASNRIGRLTLASIPSVATNLVPSLCPASSGTGPASKSSSWILIAGTFAYSSRRGRRISELPDDRSRVPESSSSRFVRDRFKVVCSSESDLVIAGKSVHWSELEGENLILKGASEKIETSLYRVLAGKASIQVWNVTSLLALAKAGFGTTLLPVLAVVHLPDGVVALDLADEEVWRMVGLLRHGDSVPSPLAFAFREFVLDELPKLARTLGLQVVSP